MNNQLYDKAFWILFSSTLLFYNLSVLPVVLFLGGPVLGYAAHSTLWTVGFFGIWITASFVFAIIAASSLVPGTASDEEFLSIIHTGRKLMWCNLAGLACVLLTVFYRRVLTPLGVFALFVLIVTLSDKPDGEVPD